MLALAIGAGPAAASSVVLAHSQVTTPADPFFALYDLDHPGTQTFNLAGTSDGSGGTTDIRCQSHDNGSYAVASGVAVQDNGTFAQADAPLPALPSNGATACVVEALPPGHTTGDLPGAPSPSFSGPRAYLGTIQSNKNEAPNDNVVNSVLAETQKPGGGWANAETGGCAEYDSWLTDPTTLASSPSLFFCNAWLYWSNADFDKPTNGPGTRSQLIVDGQNAYLPYSVDQINSKASGAPATTVDYHYDNTNGDLTVHSVEPVVRCVSGDPHSSGAQDCPSVTSTGVQVETWVTDSGAGAGTSQVLQRFESTGGTHQLDMLFDNEDNVNRTGTNDGGFRFPWFNSGYQPFGLGTVPAPPSGPGSFFFKHDMSAADGTPDGIQGVQTFAAAPESLTLISPTDASTGGADVELGYHRTVTDTTPAWFGWSFAMAENPTDLASAAHTAEASFPPPHVAITGPGNGSTTSSATAHVTGTSSDPSSPDLARVDVNGHAATVAPDGSWSADVPLAPGSNNLTATALNRYDTPTRATISLNYNPPASPAHVFHGAAFRGTHTLRLDRHGNAIISVFCPADSAPSCAGTVVLTSASKVVAAAAKHKARVIRLGSRKFRVKPGKTAKLKIKISKAGRKLISTKGKLAARITITSKDSAAQKKTKHASVVLKPFRRH